MDVTRLASVGDGLLAGMLERGYSKGYIGRFASMLSYITENAEAEGWSSYDDVLESYSERVASRHVLRQAKSVLRGIERFDRDGALPGDGHRHRRGGSRELLGEPFARVIDGFVARELGRGAKRRSTIESEASCAAGFLLAMQRLGRERPEDVTEADVLGFFFGGGVLTRSKSHIKSVGSVMGAAAKAGDEGCAAIAGFLPRPLVRKPATRPLDEGERAAVMRVLRGDSLRLRDRAIGLLLVSYGLRRSDVSGLRLADIDWESSVLRIRQQKTGAPVELPLLPEAGNALCRYIAEERPDRGDPYVFQSLSRPYGRLSPGGVYGVATRVLDLAGVERRKGEPRGSHLFRHGVATAMLGAESPRPVISGVLGHDDPRSVEAYLSADIVHLRACALSIAPFPIPEEVFERWRVSMWSTTG